MHLTVKFVLFLLYVTACCSKKSISIVVDTSFSMKDEIDIIRTNLGSVLNSLVLSGVNKYILVPFKDPDVGPPYVCSNPTGLLFGLNNLTVSDGDGNECPENVLSAIQEALQASDPGSHIFVFTDAYANDNIKLAGLQNLCRSTRSQVVIFLSGSCIPTRKTPQVGSVEVYFDVVKACNGGIFQLEFDNLRKAFLMMKEIMKSDWNDIKTYDAFATHGTIEFSVDYSTTDLTITVFGENPSLQVYRSHSNYWYVAAHNVTLQTSSFMIVRLSELRTGNYKVIIRSRGRTSATVYKINDIPIQIRFCTRRTNILKLTSSRPIPGWNNYIQLIVSPPDTTIKLRSLTLHEFKTNTTSQFDLEEDDEYNGQYIVQTHFDHDTSFQITVVGEDTANHQEFTKSTEILETQKSLWGQVKDVPDTKPQVEILPLQPLTPLLDYGSNVNFACRVTGYPKPDISWEGADNLVAEDISTIEIPNVFASYATLSNFKNNITIRCKASNSKGEDDKSMDLFVNSTVHFEVRQAPQDETIEYGAEGKLNCEVEAYPEATTSWYHNNTLLSSFSRQNIEIGLHNQSISIKYMTLEDTGEYKCEIKNEFETKYYAAKIEISGLEAPQIELESTELLLHAEDWKEVDCKASGKPTPDITWKYKNDDDYDFGAVPDGVYVEDSKIKFSSVTVEHAGTYKCEASNIVGQADGTMTVKVQYAPIIENVPETLTVNEGDMVELHCDVDALPKAKVQWEMNQGDVSINLDKRHTIDDHNTLRFEALWNNSGNYHCIAENSLGRKNKTVAVNVLVKTYIQPPPHRNITMAVGSSLSLVCNILYGNPLPSTVWEFISLSSTRTILSSANSTKILILSLQNISKNQEGQYICKADNGLSSDSIKIYLRVK